MTSEQWTTVLAALFGGVLGAAVGQYSGHVLQRRRRREAELDRQIGGYLWQMQDATESLWFRLHNLHDRGARTRLSSDYYERSTLYTIAIFLAQKRRLGSAGTYALLNSARDGSGDTLRAALESVESALGRANPPERHFQRYDRLALAECALRETAKGDGLDTYSAFVGRLEDAHAHPGLEQARAYVNGPLLDRLDEILGPTEVAGRHLEAMTGLQWKGGREVARQSAAGSPAQPVTPR